MTTGILFASRWSEGPRRVWGWDLLSPDKFWESRISAFSLVSIAHIAALLCGLESATNDRH